MESNPGRRHVTGMLPPPLVRSSPDAFASRRRSYKVKYRFEAGTEIVLLGNNV
jgi:hypothetical protein